MNIFKKPTPLQLAQRELLDAELAKLTAQTAMEYATSMVDYNQARIDRLSLLIEMAEGKA